MKEQMIEITGWHYSFDEDEVYKVDRCIKLDGFWRYHVIECESGAAADHWTVDTSFDDVPECGVFETREQAKADGDRMLGLYQQKKEEAEREREAEDDAIAKRLADFSRTRVQDIVQKADEDLCVVTICRLNRMRNLEAAMTVLENGGVEYNKTEMSFIPLGAIDRVYKKGGKSYIETRAGETCDFPSELMYEAISLALKIYAKQ